MNKAVLATILASVALAMGQPQQICPVQITKIDSDPFGMHMVGNMLDPKAIPRGEQAYLVVHYKNVSDKTVATVRFGLAYLNSMHELENTDTLDTSERKIKPGDTAKVLSRDGSIWDRRKKPSGWVEKILFSDGTYWNDNGSRSCGNFTMPEEKPSDTPGTQSSGATAPKTPRLWKDFAGNPHAMLAFVRKGGVMTMISSVPQASAVKVGDIEIGTTPLMLALLPKEKYTISVVREGYKTFTRDVTAGDTVIVQLEADNGVVKK
jgi:hypothetical protein